MVAVCASIALTRGVVASYDFFFDEDEGLDRLDVDAPVHAAFPRVLSVRALAFQKLRLDTVVVLVSNGFALGRTCFLTARFAQHLGILLVAVCSAYLAEYRCIAPHHCMCCVNAVPCMGAVYADVPLVLTKRALGSSGAPI